MRTTMRVCVLVLSALCFNASIFSQQVAKSIPNSTSPDGIIGFLQFTPSDYGSQKHPLIIFLHGIGERGNGTSQIQSITDNAIPKFCAAGASMRFTVNGQTSSFVVLSPQLSVQYGSWPTFYVHEMIKYALANLQIDPNRIYVCGLSLGGGGVWDVITEAVNGDYSFDGTIAAAAPVCGTQEENDANFCNTIGGNHLPVWAFHSMDDGTVGVQATQHAQILSTNCGITSPAPIFTYYQSGGHAGAWINAYDTGHITVPTVVNGNVVNFTQSPNLYEWFLSNTRGATTTTTINTAPIANAGNSTSVILPINSVNLTGTGTGTNGAIISSYTWVKTSGPSSGTITSPNSAITSVTGLTQGTYVFTLTVTDNHGLTGSSSITITVTAAVAVNQVPIANAGANQTITLPTNTVTLNGSGSYDPDGSIVTYWWTQTTGPAGATMTTRNAVNTAVTGLVAGTYSFDLEVTDNGGLSAYSNTTVTVNTAPVNSSAQGLSANAGANQTITLPANTATLNGSASSDQGGSITSYWWTQTSGPAGLVMVSRNAATTLVTGIVAGTYTFDLEVTDNNGLTAYSNMSLTVNAASATSLQPAGYIRPTAGLWQTCTDTGSDGRIPIYCSNVANGSIVYLDAGLTTIYNGGWNWFSLMPVLGGAVTAGLSIYPDGTIHLLTPCSQTTTTVTNPTGGLLGYVKISVGPYQACADASSNSRIPIYGTKLATDGTLIYTDAAMTQIFNGGWNWYSFTPTVGAQVTYAFVIYPIGSIGMLRNCSSGSRSNASEEATLVQSADATAAVKLDIYPNPIHSTATIQLNSSDNGTKTINVYNASGILTAKYNWQTFKGNNTYSLKNISGLPAGLYIADIRDSNGKPVGKVKFVKQ